MVMIIAGGLYVPCHGKASHPFNQNFHFSLGLRIYFFVVTTVSESGKSEISEKISFTLDQMSEDRGL